MSFLRFFVYRFRFYKLNDILTKYWGGVKRRGGEYWKLSKRIKKYVVLGPLGGQILI